MAKTKPTGLNAALAFVRERNIHVNAAKAIRRLSTGCPPMDHAIHALPMGAVVEAFGPESSGKCVALSTLVPVAGEGLLTVGELLGDAPWKANADGRLPDQSVDLLDRGRFVGASCGRLQAVSGGYWAGPSEPWQIRTVDGNDLRARPEHRVLALRDSGVCGWSQAQYLRRGDAVVTSVGHAAGHRSRRAVSFWADGSRFVVGSEAAWGLAGALAAAQRRDDRRWIPTTAAAVRNLLRAWAREAGAEAALGGHGQFVRFSGLLQAAPGIGEALADWARGPAGLAAARTACLEFQVAWLKGLTLAGGHWTGDDLEFSVPEEDVAAVAKALLANLGIRTTAFRTISVFGHPEHKLGLRGRDDQARATRLLWAAGEIPPSWLGRLVPEGPAADPLVRRCLERANEEAAELRRRGADVPDADVEDQGKASLRAAAERLLPYQAAGGPGAQSRRRLIETLLTLADPATSIDRVTECRRDGGPEDMADVAVPIGCHWATGGLVSHNSTLALHCMGKVLEAYSGRDDTAVYLDYEQTMTEEYMRDLGLGRYLDEGRLVLTRPQSLEQADPILSAFWTNTKLRMAVIDSVAAMTPDVMLEDPDDDEGVREQKGGIGKQARGIAVALNRWTKSAPEHGTLILMLNQLRNKITVQKFGSFARPNVAMSGVPDADNVTTPGGWAMRYFATQRWSLEPTRVDKEEYVNPMTGEKEQRPVAVSVKLRCVKNKLGPPHGTGRFYIHFGHGIDVVRSLVEVAKVQGVVKAGGSWISFQPAKGEGLRCQGMERFLEKVRKSPGLQDALAKSLRWDRAGEIVAKAVGRVSVDLKTGVSDGEVTAGGVEAARAADSTAERATLLGIAVRDGKAWLWTDEAGVDHTGATPDELWEALAEDSRQELMAAVAEALEEGEGDGNGEAEAA